ncbi:MAG: hypothetical protein JNK46_07135 [Methylobacteriaceae bacterium]|nr:hypothetical protein [Methylobacteriaceae bacterium]
MKIVIVGAGALGSVYAANLARDGHDVSLVTRGARAQALAVYGVPVTGVSRFTARCDIVTEPRRLRAADHLVLATKTYDAAGALEGLRALNVGLAFSVQNGVQEKRGSVADVPDAGRARRHHADRRRSAAAVDERLGAPLIDVALTGAAMLHRSEDEPVAIMQAFAAGLRDTALELSQSMLQDAERGGRLELDETLDCTLSLARCFGMAAPTLELCRHVLRMVSRTAR